MLLLFLIFIFLKQMINFFLNFLQLLKRFGERCVELLSICSSISYYFSAQYIIVLLLLLLFFTKIYFFIRLFYLFLLLGLKYMNLLLEYIFCLFIQFLDFWILFKKLIFLCILNNLECKFFSDIYVIKCSLLKFFSSIFQTFYCFYIAFLFFGEMTWQY